MRHLDDVKIFSADDDTSLLVQEFSSLCILWWIMSNEILGVPKLRTAYWGLEDQFNSISKLNAMCLLGLLDISLDKLY